MNKEFLTDKHSTLTVNITGGTVDSFRKIVETTATVRAYDNGFIGIAGKIGAPDAALETEAAANLENKMPYPDALTNNGVKAVDVTQNIINPDHLLSLTRELTEELNSVVPNMIFSGQVKYREAEKTYKNTLGSDLKFKGNIMFADFAMKARNSANIFDAGYGTYIQTYNKQQIIDNVKLTSDCFFNNLPALSNGKYKVVFEPTMLFNPMLKDLIGEIYAGGSSLFKGKLGERIFSEKLSVLMDTAPDKKLLDCFFDAEGEIADGYKAYIVKNGVFENVLTTKKTAAVTGLGLIKSADAAYDGLPGIGLDGFCLGEVGGSLEQLIGDDRAIVVSIASGGDITGTGDFATPCQLAFLYENGKPVGKLPDLKIYGNAYDILGDSYVGTSRDGYYKGDKSQNSVAYFNVEF